LNRQRNIWEYLQDGKRAAVNLDNPAGGAIGGDDANGVKAFGRMESPARVPELSQVLRQAYSALRVF